MAITTVDGIIAGLRPPEAFGKVGVTTVAGRFFSLAYLAGRPGAAAVPSPGLAGASLTSYGGQIPWTNPGAGNSYLARFAADCNVPGTLYLVDRLWHNSGIVVTSTGAQTINSTAWPARDRDGTDDGADVMVGMEVSTVLGAATPTLTLRYTNQAGTSGRASTSAAIASAMAAGSFIPLDLQAGDTGVRSIEEFELSASMISGAVHLVAYRVLAMLPIALAGVARVMDAVELGLPRLYDNTVPFLLWMPNGTGAPTVNGQLAVAQG